MDGWAASPPPHGARVFLVSRGTRHEITPDVLDSVAMLLPDLDYVAELTPPPGGDLIRVKLQWIHIRDTATQLNLDKVFNAFAASGAGVTLGRKNPEILVADHAKPRKTAIELTLTAQDAAGLARSGLEAHHSYLWPRIHMTGTGITDVQFDVKTRGIGYYGG